MQGALKNKTTDLDVVGWFFGGQKRTRAGQICFPRFVYRVFDLPSPRNAHKRDKQIREKYGFVFFGRFLVKTFRHGFFCKNDR
jgi:hypothetical protein